MKKGVFDTYIGAALEYDIFAGGDPNRPKSDRYTTQAAANADQSAVAEKEATDAGITPQNDASQVNQNSNDNSDLNMNAESENMDDQSTEQSDESDELPEDGGDQSDINSDNMEDETATSGDSSPNPDEKLNKERKEILFEIISSLHGAICNNITMLQKINPPLEEKSNKVYYDVINHLQYCKDILYKIAIDKLQTDDYIDILRKVTAISKVYELSIESIKLIYPKNN